MNRKWLSTLILAGVATALLNTSSCARDQRLVSITLSPAEGFTFEGFGATGQFTAYGTYIHPPETKDITNKVVWSVDIANFATITQQGLITYDRTDGCGRGLVNATFNSHPSNPSSGSVIVGSAPVQGWNDANCK